LYIAFLLSNHVLRVQFLKEVGRIPSIMKCCKCGHKCPGVSSSVLKTVTDGNA